MRDYTDLMLTQFRDSKCRVSVFEGMEDMYIKYRSSAELNKEDFPRPTAVHAQCSAFMLAASAIFKRYCKCSTLSSPVDVLQGIYMDTKIMLEKALKDLGQVIRNGT